MGRARGDEPNPTTASPLGKVLWGKTKKGRKRDGQHEARSKAYKKFQADFRERAQYPGKVLDWSRYCLEGR
ncbi:MAG: hypothetical protein M0D55_15865 [Elusimicrobiota bacterium]|nr:MAG: hypothetical protein M0D55_15865 [Elusimicrobiota bacterium]